jgi:glycine cleavage system aminomethyltransferase T
MCLTWVRLGDIIRIHGKDRQAFLEKVLVGDVVAQSFGQSSLSLILNDKAGIIDDAIFSNHGEFM